jgi:hypothetical protein
MAGDSDFVVVPDDLDFGTDVCCPNADPFPYKCPACGKPMAFCRECSTQYPSLPDTRVRHTDNNSSDPLKPSHRCPRCGHAFEFFFLWNAAYAVTRGEWRATGLGDLLAPDHRQDAEARHRTRGVTAALSLPQEIFDVPWRAPWTPVIIAGPSAELTREAGPKHPLHHRPAVAIGRRLDDDDVLFYLPAGPAPLAVVHLTYSARLLEPDPRFPHTTLYESVQEWVDTCMIPDSEGQVR